MLLKDMQECVIDGLYVFNASLLHRNNYKILDCVTKADVRNMYYIDKLIELLSKGNTGFREDFEGIYSSSSFILIDLNDVIYVFDSAFLDETYRKVHWDKLNAILDILLVYAKEYNKNLYDLYCISTKLLKGRCLGFYHTNIDNNEKLVYYIITGKKNEKLYKECKSLYIDTNLNKVIDTDDDIIYSQGYTDFATSDKVKGTIIDKVYGLTVILYRKGDTYLIQNELYGTILLCDGKYYQVKSFVEKCNFDADKHHFYRGNYSNIFSSGKDLLQLRALSLDRWVNVKSEQTYSIIDFLNSLLNVNCLEAKKDAYILQDCVNGYILMDWDTGIMYNFWDIDIATSMVRTNSSTINVYTRDNFNLVLLELKVSSLMLYKVDDTKLIYDFNLDTKAITVLGDYKDNYVQTKLKSIREDLMLGLKVNYY